MCWSRFEEFYDFLVELEEEVLPETLVPEELLQGGLEPATTAAETSATNKKAKPWERAEAADTKTEAVVPAKKLQPPFPVPPLVDEKEEEEEEDWADLRLGDVVTVSGKIGKGD